MSASGVTQYADLDYDRIFDEKYLAILATGDFKTAIAGYITKYNELIASSLYFKKGIFNYYNAGSISKSLTDHGFFKASHTVNLNGDNRLEITSQKDLDDLIAAEKESISSDTDLKAKFAAIEKVLNKNVDARSFESYLSDHEDILPELADMATFKRRVWLSYLNSKYELLADLVSKYQAAEQRKKEIEEQASKERTQWETVIDIFNSRFFVPFKLTATNKQSVVLGEQPMLTVNFRFEDGADHANVERPQLMQTLSTGEKKALYILNIIFEVEARKMAHQETIFIVDDIADSFDYRNKYAIIQYLKDIADVPFFHQIILTHNFDFFRTLHSRFIAYPQCLLAIQNQQRTISHASCRNQKRLCERLEAPLF